MKKALVLMLTVVFCLSLFTGCAGNTGNAGSSADKQLNLYTWEGMFPQEVLDGFEKETGIKINYINFDFDETMLAKLETANGGDYDLVIADDYIIETTIAEGLAQKLDRSRIKNLANVNPIYQGQFYDPNDEYTVPYGAGIQTIVYNPAAVDIDVKGYSDLWDPAFKDNVGIIANYRVINGMALKVLGESYNTNDLDTIRRAGDKLLELAPNIRIIKDDNLQDDLISGEISAAVLYSSQVTMAMLADPSLKSVCPQEGLGLGVMGQFIPSNAPHPDAAYAFIDYLLRPEVAKDCFEWLGYYCTTEAADDLIAEEYRSFLTLPDNVTEDNVEMIENISAEAEEVHTLIWTEFKAACGQ